MSDISKQITENALRGNLVELSQRNEQTHLQIRTLNEMVGRLRKENAKLREALAYTFKTECAGRPIDCETCAYKCPFGKVGALMAELRIEVPHD